MNRPFAALLLAIGSVAVLATPAAAQFFFPFGPRYWAPPPYYSPPPAYYPPAPPADYPPPPPGYYPPGEAVPPGAAAQPGAPVPPGPPTPPGAPAPAAAPAPTATGAAPSITYTKRPAFKNAEGDTCREYTTTVSGSTVSGTACRDRSGQWRIAN